MHNITSIALLIIINNWILPGATYYIKLYNRVSLKSLLGRLLLTRHIDQEISMCHN